MVERLFTYGTLSPGQPNAHMLQSVSGEWEAASVLGKLYPNGWGAALGYPALVLDVSGPVVQGFLLSSEELSPQWAMLDEFEGRAYRRELTQVRKSDGSYVTAYVYALNPDA